MGAERRSMILGDKEKRQIAYHESGHTLVAKFIPDTDPVHKVTIIPRGMALGLTQQLPEGDSYIHTKDYTENTIAVLMGGRCAEEIIFGTKTTGAGNDIEHATELAHKMVCEWGMSDKLGPLAYGRKEEEVFLGRDILQSKDYSEQTSITIDEEVKRIVTDNYNRARKLLEANLSTLHRMAKYLLEHESLEGDQIDKIIRGEDLPPPSRPAAPTASAPAEPAKKTEAAPPDVAPALGPTLRPGFSV
jgi:cell division protease FtsH